MILLGHDVSYPNGNYTCLFFLVSFSLAVCAVMHFLEHRMDTIFTMPVSVHVHSMFPARAPHHHAEGAHRKEEQEERDEQTETTETEEGEESSVHSKPEWHSIIRIWCGLALTVGRLNGDR